MTIFTRDMKQIVSRRVMLLLVNILFLGTAAAQDNPDFPPLEDRYFGEKSPGLVPVEFAPGILSPDGLFEGGSFSPDMKEYYFSRKNGKYKERTFFVIRYENNQWGNESETDIKWPRYSKDGNIMYKGNQYRERTDSGWSALKSMGPPFTDKHIMGISVSDNGTFYFDQFERPDTVGAISYSRLINGKYEPRQKMGPEINTGTWIAHPHIAPDESYLIWDVEREDGYGGSEIYISFRKKDGSWLPAINMGPQINTPLQESGAGVTPDGKYLFFSRGEWKVREDGSEYWVGKPYWVNAQVIENLRPKDLDFPPLTDRYFGQEPPDLTPKLFAPGIVATDEYMEGYLEYTADMKELYFTRLGGEFEKRTLQVMQYNNDKWSSATALPGSITQYRERYEPHWSEVRTIEAFKDLPIVGFSVSSTGTYYLYFMNYENGSGHLSYSRLIDGKYESPQKMSTSINAGLWKAHPYVAPDESYLMWDAEQEGVHGADIYISFRQQDGSWGPAINMGDRINTGAYEQGARVTPDGKYLLFWRGDEKKQEDGSIKWEGSPYWVDASIIETLRSN